MENPSTRWAHAGWEWEYIAMQSLEKKVALGFVAGILA